MDDKSLEEHFKNVWVSTTELCLNRLEGEEKQDILRFKTYEDVQKHAIHDSDEADEKSSPAVLQELVPIKPRLIDLWNFSTFFAGRLGTKLDPSVFWGLLGLMLEHCQNLLGFPNAEAPRHVADMVKKSARQAETLRSLCSRTASLSNKQKEICFDAFVALSKMFCETVVFLREHEGSMGQQGQDPWHQLTEHREKTSRELEESQVALENLARHMSLHHPVPFLPVGSRSQGEEVAKLPCIMMPPALHGGRFFNRDDVIKKIEASFGRQEETFRSVALHGIGGIGKTAVARRYIGNKRKKGEVDAVLWIDAEKESSIKASFTTIGKSLELPNINEENPDANQFIVMGWLQRTSCKWLLVYDNVEALNTVLPFWPSSAFRGHALITTRNHSFSFELAEDGIEVLPWSTEQGSKFLIYLLRGRMSAELLAAEEMSALDLADKAAGHALAMEMMAGVIHRRQFSLKELNEVYNSQPHFDDKVEAIWKLSFEGLKPESAKLLSVLSFCSPDDIPRAIFEPDNPAVVPKDMRWCQDQNELGKALETLQTLALVKRGMETGNMSVHRLIQNYFLRYLGGEGRQQSFIRASVTLYHLFPQRDAGKGQLYNVWERCSLWLQHVISLKDGYKLERQQDSSFKACREFCELLVNCQRFLLEQHAFRDLDDMVAENQAALDTLTSEDRTYDMLASLPSHLGHMYIRLGQQRKALESALKSRNIRLEDPDGDLREVAWAESNIGQILVTSGSLEDGLKWHTMAKDTWAAYDQKQQPPSTSVPPLFALNIARCLVYMGKLDEAEPIVASALSQLLEARPLMFGAAAFAHFTLGRIEMKRKNWEAATTKFSEAQAVWLEGDKARTDVFNGACEYRMACCALEEFRVEIAMKHLRDAMFATAIHKTSMPGDHARCLFKWSQALSHEAGRETEADQALREAEELYASRAEAPSANPTEENYDSLVYLLWR